MLSIHYLPPPIPPPSSFFQSGPDVADKRSVRCLFGYKEASVQASSGAPPQAFLCSCPIPPFWSYHRDVESGLCRCFTCTGEDGGIRNTWLSL